MFIHIIYLILGLILLVWSAEKFIDGASHTARYLGMSPLLIGIVIIGFGTSAPEMLVSASSALNNASGIALGNAYGSNIANIALILGLTALIKPIQVANSVFFKELPILLLVTLLSAYLINDAAVSRIEAAALLIIFAVYMGYTVFSALRAKENLQKDEQNQPLVSQMPRSKAYFWLIVGLLVLMLSSRLLVLGAVGIAKALGMSDLVIGLTIVAVGTSLPELASSLVAARKGEADLALGNIIGSNLFNSLAVVGIAGVIQPMQVEAAIFSRDMLVMAILTFALWFFSLQFGQKPRKINRLEGGILLSCFIGYSFYLLKTAL